MAKKEEQKNPQDEAIQATPEEVEELEEKVEEVVDTEEKEEANKEKSRDKRRYQRDEVEAVWEPKTKIGKDVKNGKIKTINEILEKNIKILEPQIVDNLVKIESDLISIGQAKGKFGGGKRRAWRQTQRKTEEGNVLTFSSMAVVGDGNGHIGIGVGKAVETLPARDKAVRKAKLSLFGIKRSCSGFDCNCNELHTVPFKVTGRAGSTTVILIPAPQGTGLVVGGELKKVLALAGIKDVYSKTFGKKRTSFNLVKACIEALKKTNNQEAAG